MWCSNQCVTGSFSRYTLMTEPPINNQLTAMKSVSGQLAIGELDSNQHN